MKIKKLFVILAIVIVFLYVLQKNVSMNFTILGILGIVFMFLMQMVRQYVPDETMSKLGLENADKRMPIKNGGKLLFWANILFCTFVVLVFLALDNYFFASKEVYSNNEHHAIKVEGIRPHNLQGFILAADDHAAFFDKSSYCGKLVVQGVDTINKQVTLSLDHFPHPIYIQKRINGKSRDSLCNGKLSIVFEAGDTVTFVNRNKEQLDFWIQEFDNAERDSANYYFRYKGTVQKSSFSTLLTVGYDFNGILDDIQLDDFSFAGFSLVRAITHQQAMQSARSDKGNSLYALDFTSSVFKLKNESSTVKVIKTRKSVYDLDEGEVFCGKVQVPLNENLFIGFDQTKSQVFSFQQDSINSFCIQFRDPIYRQLLCESDKIENSLYITNSLSDDISNQLFHEGSNVPNNVLAFDLFNHKNNLNVFQPFTLFFAKGSTTEKMQFIVQSEGDEFSVIQGDDGQFPKMNKVGAGKIVDWLFQIENLRNNTPFSAEKMLMLVFWVVIGCLLSLNFNYCFAFSRQKFHRIPFSYPEFCIYIVVLFLVAFRCVLLWRTSVFRPLENISQYELNTIFYQEEHFTTLRYCLLGFFCSIILLKCYFLVKKTGPGDRFIFDRIYYVVQDSIVKWLNNKWLNNKWAWGIAFVIYLIGFISSKSSSNTRLVIILGIFLYLLFDMIINVRNPIIAYEEQKEDDRRQIDAHKHAALNYILQSLANMFCIMPFFIRDKGFLILFITFCVLAFCYKLQEFYTRLYKRNGRRLIITYLTIFAFVVICLTFYNSLLIFALETRWTYVLIPLAWLALLGWIYYISGVKPIGCTVKKNEPHYWVTWISAVIMCVASVVGAIWFDTPSDIIGDHTKQRINVQLYSPQDALSMTKTNGDERRFLQASHNHWIIAQYNERSKRVKLFGEGGDGYFKIHPQSKLGAMWGAQMTDLVVLRYVITEHSRILPVVILLMFLMMLFYGIRTVTYYRFTKSLLIQIPLLLLVQGLLTWLANTQRFIFLGQDFPFISITPKVMLAYCFALITIWTLIAIVESTMYRRYNRKLYVSMRNFYKFHSSVSVIAMLLLVFVSILIKEPEVQKSSDYKISEKIGRKKRLSMVEPYVEKIDSLFAQCQSSRLANHCAPLDFRSDMHSEISLFDSLYADQIDSVIKVVAEEKGDSNLYYHFPHRKWKNFVNRESKGNSANNLIHIRKGRDRLVLSVMSGYYDLNLPSITNNEWKGHITASSTNEYQEPVIINNNDYTYYRLPKEWVKDESYRHIIKCVSNKGLQLKSSRNNQRVNLHKDNILEAVAFTSEDYLLPNSDSQQLPIKTEGYWAKNILLNGKSKFVYPSGEEMYWVKDFAELAKRAKDEELHRATEDSIPIIRGQNLPVTLNIDLTHKLYSILKDYAHRPSNENSSDTLIDYSVLVADGNGHVHAMVDYKRGYELNPNDDKLIQRLQEELYMNVDGKRIEKEGRYFEDRNLAELRGGPGSTQKPLVWTAVASGVENFDWSSLVMNRVEKELIDYDYSIESKPYLIKLYNEGIVAKFISLRSDENYGKTDIDLSKYFMHSSNYYSSMMVYIGLQPIQLLNQPTFYAPSMQKDSLKLFRLYKSSDIRTKQDYLNNFPFMKINNSQNVCFSRNLQWSDFQHSLLKQQLEKCYHLSSHYEQGKRYVGSLYPHLWKDSYEASYAIPIISSLNFDIFKKGPVGDFPNNVVRGIAIGQGDWTVTPFMMASMYGQMISLDSDFSLTMDPHFTYRDHTEHNQLIGQGNAQFRRAYPMMLNSMSGFFKDGTGKHIRDIKDKEPQNDWYSCNIQYDNHKYYIYGKTGTTTYKKDNETNNVRRLAIIISESKLNNEDLECHARADVKFFILYFTFDIDRKDLNSVASDVIKEVATSDAFKQYMN